jgi:hypothetical protein
VLTGTAATRWLASSSSTVRRETSANIVNAGRFYLGPRVNERMFEEGMEQPVVFWVPSIATSGLTFYTGDRFPNQPSSRPLGRVPFSIPPGIAD